MSRKNIGTPAITQPGNHNNPQTPLRWQVQQNGYAWVPNNGKRSRGRKWSQAAIDRLEAPDSTNAVTWWDDPHDSNTGEVLDLPNLTTGVVIEGDLVALDVDIDDPAAVAAMFELAASIFGQEWHDSVPVRYRAGSAKEAWLFRVSKPRPGDVEFRAKGKFAGPSFFEPGFDPEIDQVEGLETVAGWTRAVAGAKSHMIEVFRGGDCQIGALGWHTVPDPDECIEGIEYEWEDNRSPATVPRWELPEVTHARLYEFMSHHSARLKEMGWVPSPVSVPSDGVKSYTLDTSKLFYTGTKGSLPEQVSYHGLSKGMPIRMAEVLGLDPNVDGSNPERGFVTERHDGVLGIHDSQDAVTYYPPSANPDLEPARAERLGKLLGSLGHTPPEDVPPGENMTPDDGLDADPDAEVLVRATEILHEAGVVPSVEGEDLEAVLEEYRRATRDWYDEGDNGYQVEARALLLALRWMFVRNLAAKSDARWHPMAPGHADLPTAEFKALFDDLVQVKVGTKVDADNRPTTQWLPVVNVFLSHNPLQIRTHGDQFAYWSDTAIVRAKENDQVTKVNSYTPPVLGEPRKALVELFDDFLEHLFDRPEERAIFEEVMAYKFANPGARGVTHIFVADGVEGTGRNTLFEGFIFNALGADNCMKLASSKLGGGSQAAYTSWQYDKLMWFVPEMKGMTRAAVEVAKELMEVSSGKSHGTEKGGKDLYGDVFGTMCMATNEPGSVPLSLKSANRRFNVYSSGAKGALHDNAELFRRVNAVRVGHGTDVTHDMAATVRNYFLEVVPARLGHAPRQEVFMVAQDTPAKRRMVEMSMKQSDEFIEEAFEEFESEDRLYLEVGAVLKEAQRLAKAGGASKDAINAIPNELKTQTSGGGGFRGWTRVITDEGSDRIKIAGGLKKRILARGPDAANTLLEMSVKERSEVLAYAPEGDEKITRLASAAKVITERRRVSEEGLE
ncbi:hypothetical protein [Maritimibacter fusiformis]|uniref:DNA primase/polymerase bifunctional N-terminal domain-containing protein n=1 Tax=Maritimibacter fusiformis TaxID=2603819 RepID=A0A5D0RQF3_9RHOB|nr:hypothetical protein [Maritimibacter fusiformis]TYB83125.1 hypothetical protein FVF75_02785 [Maritimibacter fusiformis]